MTLSSRLSYEIRAALAAKTPTTINPVVARFTFTYKCWDPPKKDSA